MTNDDDRVREALKAAAGGMSLARAARIAGLSLEAFMARASAAGIPVLTEGREDDIDARTMATFKQLDEQMWPVLAALGHELDADALPSRSASEWLWSRSPAAAAAGERPGKWVIERDAATINTVWQFIHGAVQIGRLWAAKCSGLRRATFYGDRYAIIVYTPDYGDVEAVKRARAVLRELGVTEPIRYLAWDGAELLRE